MTQITKCNLETLSESFENEMHEKKRFGFVGAVLPIVRYYVKYLHVLDSVKPLHFRPQPPLNGMLQNQRVHSCPNLRIFCRRYSAIFGTS